MEYVKESIRVREAAPNERPVQILYFEQRKEMLPVR